MTRQPSDALERMDQIGLFAATQWSLVLRARDKSEAALESLFGQYREPLLVWLRAQGQPPSDAEDVLHGFLQNFLRRDALAGVNSEKGKFRTFLLQCLKNHLRDEHDRRTATKRGGGQPVESLDQVDEEGHALWTPAASSPTPDLEYDRAWAQAILTGSIERLQSECVAQGHGALWAAVEPIVFFDDTASPYREIAAQLGMTEGAVKMATSRIRARLRGIVQEQIMQTVASEQEWKEEVGYLIQLFAASH